ncbi:MAG: hypothetical protein RBJ76_24665 [Stenomitos frigidus ULC029]
MATAIHLVGSGAAAFITARNMRDPLTRPNTLASLQLAKSGSVPFLETLRDRAAIEAVSLRPLFRMVCQPRGQKPQQHLQPKEAGKRASVGRLRLTSLQIEANS